MADMIKVCGLWENHKDGKRYFTGSLGGVRIVILPNDFKKESKHPDFNLFFVPIERRERSEEKPKEQETGYTPPPPEDDIPF